MKKLFKKMAMLSSLSAIYAQQALAKSGGAGMVWEKPITNITKSISGPVAMGISTIAIVIAGLTWSFTDGGNMMGKAIKICLGVIIAFGAVTLITNIFGGGAGMLI